MEPRVKELAMQALGPESNPLTYIGIQVEIATTWPLSTTCGHTPRVHAIVVLTHTLKGLNTQ